MDNEFLLMDRIQKIKSVINKYGEENFYISFSGGKDSTVLHHLIDMALPDNQIPRVYANTGIEYNKIIEFVKGMAEKDDRIVIIKPTVPIKPMLEKEGYPFKSKRHAHYLDIYQRNGKTKTYYGYLAIPPYEDKFGKKLQCPKKLKYQFAEGFDIRVSDKCCVRLKENPLENYKKEHNKKYSILGIMASEGGRRMTAQCLAFRNNKMTAFQPLAPLTKEWEDWFIKEYGIKLCELYYPPYNFDRTGCKGCPFALHLQDELDTLEKFFPNERKQCEIIWKPVYDEYRRIGYRLKNGKEEDTEICTGQMDIFDYFTEDGAYKGVPK